MEENKPLYTREAVKAWKDRWEVVNEFQREERLARNPSVEERLRALDQLYGFLKLCPPREVREEDRRVREDWAKVYAAWNARKS